MNKKYQFGDVEVEVPEFEFKKIIPAIFLAIVVLLGYLSVYSIRAEEQGVLLRFGKFSSIASAIALVPYVLVCGYKKVFN